MDAKQHSELRVRINRVLDDLEMENPWLVDDARAALGELFEQLEAVQDALAKIAATPCYLDVLVGEADRRMLSLGDGDCASCYAALALLASFPAISPDDLEAQWAGRATPPLPPGQRSEWNSDCWKGYEGCRCRVSTDVHVPASGPSDPFTGEPGPEDISMYVESDPASEPDATAEILSDEEAMDDLRRAAEQSDDDAVDYEELRRNDGETGAA